tara:strand:+ start:158 stop:364 length:207 start_codon:yes stop_codon:yes gene_type:complete
MEIILSITPIKRFINGKRQKGETKVISSEILNDYGFSEAEIKRITVNWDVNHITRRDSKFIYKASPKY